MEPHWRSIACAAAFAARAANDDAHGNEPAQHGGAVTVSRPSATPAHTDAVRFTTPRAQRQISLYLLYRSWSADQRNSRGLEWWREALRRNAEAMKRPAF